MSLDEARTLFHEFGHALHGLLSDVTWPSVAGTSVSRDFVELPSQLYEHWLTVPDVLNTYALHHETGEPMPKALLKHGHRDMLRLSDARMSGTAYGTIILHIAPESHVGGPLAFVKNGDRIKLSVKERRLDLLVDDAEIARRRKEWEKRTVHMPDRGYDRLFRESVLQAPDGCDFRFLRKD